MSAGRQYVRLNVPVIKKICEHSNLTYTEISNNLGFERSWLSAYVTAKSRNVPKHVAILLATQLNVKLDDIIIQPDEACVEDSNTANAAGADVIEMRDELAKIKTQLFRVNEWLAKQDETMKDIGRAIMVLVDTWKGERDGDK